MSEKFSLTAPEVLDANRLRKHEADFTPRLVVRQLLEVAPHYAGWNGAPKRVCDPAAGAGVWADMMRRAWGGHDRFRCVAIEAREEERVHLERNADEVHIGDAIKWARDYRESFDLVATNPPFSRYCEYVDAFLPIAHDVWLLAPVDAFVRGERTNLWLERNTKWLQRVLWVPGGIAFREKGGQDFRQYGLWMWSNTPSNSTSWTVTLLARLPGNYRRWSSRPGTELKGPSQ